MATQKQPRKVLIVDDEPNVAMVLAESLESLDKGYQVETANSGNAALEKLAAGSYALVISDYKMPGMSGLDLLIAARKLAPDTQLVLMTAYGTEGLRDMVGGMELDGYIDKPFTVSQIRTIVERAVERTTENDPYRSGERAVEQPVREQLKLLQTNTGARCVMLISSNGYPVETSGQTDGLDITSVGALVAANFVAAAELAKLLGKGSIFKSSYHEGGEHTDYNIYAYDVNGDLLLVVVFGTESKPGVVWFYTKQSAAALTRLVDKDIALVALSPGQAAGAPTDEDKSAEPGPILSFEQALAAGLLPPEFSTAEVTYGEMVATQLDTFMKG
jgi:CheY-like chemotaxis protein/predicted regulator of Ras-like GTPase activity (Roadblock/LC7/MglB family)